MAEAAKRAPLHFANVAAANLPSLAKVSFRWETLPDSASGAVVRRSALAVAQGDRIFFFGGENPRTGPKAPPNEPLVKTALIFNSQSSQWETPLQIPGADTTHLPFRILGDGKVRFDGKQQYFEIDLETQAIIDIASPQFPRDVRGDGAFLADGRYVMWKGGARSVTFDPVTRKLKSTKPQFGGPSRAPPPPFPIPFALSDLGCLLFRYSLGCQG